VSEEYVEVIKNLIADLPRDGGVSGNLELERRGEWDDTVIHTEWSNPLDQLCTKLARLIL